MYPHIKSS